MGKELIFVIFEGVLLKWEMLSRYVRGTRVVDDEWWMVESGPGSDMVRQKLTQTEEGAEWISGLVWIGVGLVWTSRG